jgi:hypothetical protein
MSTGFIYVVKTVGADYQQPNLACVPTFFEGTFYFGPCKKAMRPRMNVGDYIFGISPSPRFPRRVVFATRIAEKITYSEAYDRLPRLHGPNGPIHIRPAVRPNDPFPDSHYEHIPDGNHPDDWRSDIRRSDLDAFFICDRLRSASADGSGLMVPPSMVIF